MKKNISTIIGIILVFKLFGQPTFSKSIDVNESGDIGTSIRVLQDGYLILGISTCPSNCYSLLKTDFEGNIIWKKQLNNSPYDIKTGDTYGNHGLAIKDTTKDFYFSGIIQKNGNPFDIFLAKANGSGDTLWLNTYGGPEDDLNADLFYRTDSTLLLFSDLTIGPNNKDVVWLLETDLNGKIIWQDSFGSEFGMVGRQDIIQLKNGDIAFTYLECDQTESCQSDHEKSLVLTKINKWGNIVWTKTIYNVSDLWNNSTIVLLDNGGYLISFYRINLDQGWFYPPILLWTDSMGTVVNEFDFPTESESSINDLIKTSSGIIIGTGYIDKFELGFAGWIFAMDQDGKLLWNREVIDSRYPFYQSQLLAVDESEIGGLILVGSILDTIPDVFPPNENLNIWLLKTDSLGCILPKCNELEIITLTMDLKRQESSLIIYPNPTHEKLYFEFNTNNDYQSYTIQITNYLGQYVYSGAMLEKLNSIEVSFLQEGIYFMKVYDENNQFICSAKFIKIQ